MKQFSFSVFLLFLLFTLAIGGCKSTVEPERTQFNSNLSYGTMTDVEGNTYKTITIGTQTWMAENLRTSKYRDGTAIPNVEDTTTWKTTKLGAWCYYGNDVAKGAIYGKLYNWHTVVDTHKLAPEGWHIPTTAEWTTLQKYVDTLTNVLSSKAANINDSLVKKSITKALSSQSKWISCPTLGAIGNNPYVNNQTGFSALPGGNRYLNGSFNLLDSDGFWWTVTSASATAVVATYRNFSYSFSGIYNYTDSKQNGYSVRCVKD